MAKSANQKLKILYLLKILYEKTDDKHGISMNEIVSSLEKYDIMAERKSIYSDFLELERMNIIVEKFQEGNKHLYSLDTRIFELPELKMLVDVVQSAKFITKKKSDELIKKIERFASKYESNSLQRQVYVADRVKTMNENIYYNIDGIHEAINTNKKITFKYYEWNISRELEPRRDGKLYSTSPWALTWDDENYYLISYDDVEEKTKYFRVDKMKQIEVSAEPREGRKEFENFDLAKFSKRTFGMFGGNVVKVGIEVKNDKIGIMFDRFGKDITVIKVDDEHVKVLVDVSLSNQFIGWVISLGDCVKLVEPTRVVDMMKAEIKRLNDTYL